MKETSIIIISGLSGTGKSTVLRTLEDLGYFCVDNLPVTLLPKFIQLCDGTSDDISRVALGMDVRERKFLHEVQPAIDNLRDEGYRVELIFLECIDDVLIQRFSETRRQHPLSDSGSVRNGIALEREMLGSVKLRADKIIDTSDLNVHQLRNIFQEYFVGTSRGKLAITFMSFGFKYGVPHDSDIVLDVRFMPNPYFIKELRPLNGTDEKVSQYVLGREEARRYLQMLKDFLSFQIPLFETEGKSYLTVAVGCTGGKHRSVTVASSLKDFFSASRQRVHVLHRDLEKE